MKTRLIGPCNFQDVSKYCTQCDFAYRLPSINELESILLKSGIEHTIFWSSTEEGEDLVWTGACVHGNFWKGDNDHDPTSKNAVHYALLIQLK